ncbi:MAG: site-specific DNA-methyltransferase [Vicinamibacteraceae bacterium]|nr:site-specific DNA-methyltransferase [Vicinamibacteraceae bacterium]
MATSSQPALLPTYELTHRGSRYRLFHGDCLAWLSRFPSASVDLVVTSPPYNLGVAYRSYSDDRPREEYLAWVASWIRELARVLTPSGSLFLNVGSKPTDPWAAIDVALAVRPFLHLQNTLHWVKSIAIDRDAVGTAAGLTRDLAVGHYKPINSRRFVNDCHEFVFHFTPTGRSPLDREAVGVAYQDASNVGRWRAAAGGRRCRGNTWFLPYETIQSRDRDRPHPATFPVRLAEFCARLHGVSRVRRALDPFLGLGHTMQACARLGLPCDGIEMDEGYLTEARDRVAEELTRSA